MAKHRKCLPKKSANTVRYMYVRDYGTGITRNCTNGVVGNVKPWRMVGADSDM